MEGRLPYREDKSGQIVLVILAALVAAVASAVLWGVVSEVTNHEIGIVAVAVGFIVGAVVAYVGRGAEGTHLQVIAAIGALIGIALGKYLEVVFVSSTGLFSSLTWDVYTGKYGHLWDFFDVLWIAFAVYEAVKLSKSRRYGTRPAAGPIYLGEPGSQVGTAPVAATPPPDSQL
ncbi:MAG TPA: hypothetical protein VG265_01750 [Gaiellaceae bacterium]|nr:hypothetical protein [Gaiellaceae bacterium]